METSEQNVGLAEMRAARERISGRIHRTPMLSSAAAATIVRDAHGIDLADGRLYLKAEHLQKTGSFKPRGMTNRVLALAEAQRRGGIVTVSAGNAAQAYAWAGASAGVAVTVVMPAAANRSKVEACLGYGAEVVLHGAQMSETFAEMERLVAERNLTFVHPFDDADVIAGHGSIGFEILDDLPEVHVVIVGVGGGGLISGIAAAIKETRPGTRVYGVEPDGSNAMQLSLEAGEVVRIQPQT